MLLENYNLKSIKIAEFKSEKSTGVVSHLHEKALSARAIWDYRTKGIPEDRTNDAIRIMHLS